MDREILIAKRILLLEDIAFTSSRMIKDTDSPDARGMTEVGTRWLQKLDKLMSDLDRIDHQIADTMI